MLAWVSNSDGASKQASSFAPTSQAVFLGVTITVSGLHLTTTDRIVVAHPTATGGLAAGDGCGLANERPVALAGGEARFFDDVTSSGGAAKATITLEEAHPEAVVCVLLAPSTKWTRVGSAAFAVASPSISTVSSSFGAGNSLSFSRADTLTLTLAGVGLVQGAGRLAVKLSGVDCSVHNATGESDLAGGDAVGLASASPAGTSGTAVFSLQHTASLSAALRLCLSSTGGAYAQVASLTAGTYTTRAATGILAPLQQLVPGVETAFSVAGTNLAADASVAALFLKVASACSGGDESDVGGGAARVTTRVSPTQASASFTLGPVEEGVHSIAVEAGGTGYLSGVLNATGGGGSGLVGVAVAGVHGDVQQGYVSSRGTYSSEPTIQPAFAGAVKCGADEEREGCVQDGAVTRITKGFGITRGCVKGMKIRGEGGDGSGFEAEVTVVDSTGIIQGIIITNYGEGYLSPPSLYTELLSCLCGNYIIDGEPIPESYEPTTVLGNIAPCYTVSVAAGARLSARGGWSASAPLLCARFAASGAWSQVGAPLTLPAATTGTTFLPSSGTSGVPFSLTVVGTGFLSEAGPLQTRIKVAFDCDSDVDSDVNGAISGGEGSPCLSLSVVESVQVCVVNVTLVAPVSITALQVCRRIGAGKYIRVGSANLAFTGFALTASPTASAYSNSEVDFVITATHLSRAAMQYITVKICPLFACAGGADTDNNEEACAGLSDTTTCVGLATCLADLVCSGSNTSSSFGTLSGGADLRPADLAGCASGSGDEVHECSELQLSTTLITMATIPAVLYWRFEHPRLPGPAGFDLLASSQLSVQGSVLLGVEQFGPASSPVRASHNFTFWVRGVNILALGTAAKQVRFKYTTGVRCSACEAGACDSGFSDTDTAFLGGAGRGLDHIMGTRDNTNATLTFNLRHTKTENQRVRLCWRIGAFRYREATSASSETVDTVVVGSKVLSFSPSDYMTTDVVLAKKALPAFASNEVVEVVVMGKNLGDVGESPMRIRAVPMPFSMTDSAEGCVLSSTTLISRPPTCKEFRFYTEFPDGNAHDFCTGGSGIDTVPLVDFNPVNITQETRVFDILEETRAFAHFNLQLGMIFPETRAMVCWRMGDDGEWQVIGHLQQKQQDQGVNGIVTWDVFVAHTLSFVGAYVESVAPATPLKANTAATVTLTVVGMPCSATNPAFKVKLAVANTFQGMVGSPVGGGCQIDSESDTLGTVEGGSAVTPRCRADLSTNQQTVVEFDVTVAVESPLPIEVCWSSTTGTTAYENAFYLGRQAIVTLSVDPPLVNAVLINARAIGEVPLSVHNKFSISIDGEGLRSSGLVVASLAVAESCEGNPPVPLPGGTNQSGDCYFAPSAITAEFTISQPSASARVCSRGSTTQQLWVRHLPGDLNNPMTIKLCEPSYCGAPLCQAGSNYLFDGFACDEVCCQAKCDNDKFCRYWQHFVIPGRVFRKCQTMAHCFDMTIQTDIANRGEPRIYQRTVGVVHTWSQLGPAFRIKGPEILAVTPQQHPYPRAGTFFAVNLQGLGFALVGQQVSVKVMDKARGGGRCNDDSLAADMLQTFDALAIESESINTFLRALVNFSFNGTCAGGEKNCEGGPAPIGTVCATDASCIPAAGGACVAPNTGMSCLLDNICTFGGACNNSRYNDSLLPAPVAPAVRIPATIEGVALDNTATVPGGEAQLVDVKDPQLAYAYFRVTKPSEGVICATLRNPRVEAAWTRDGSIVNRNIILTMSSYFKVGEVRVRAPTITEAFPDHTAPHVATTFRLGGLGLSLGDVVKVVRAHNLCEDDVGGVKAGIPWVNSVGAVLGGETRKVTRVDALGLRSEVVITVREPPTGDAVRDEYMLCYSHAFLSASGVSWRRPFERAGQVWMVNRPPAVEAFAPAEMFFAQLNRLVFNGTGLGAGHRIKLVPASQPGGCRGDSLDEANSDAALLLHGTPTALVTGSADAADFVTLQDPAHPAAARTANHAFTPQAWASIRPQAPMCADTAALLCIKYASIGDPASVAGYHLLGPVAVRTPKATALLTSQVASGVESVIEVSGEGLLTEAVLSLKVIHSFAACSDLDAGGFDASVAGGSSIRLVPSQSSATRLEARVRIDTGVDGPASVCFRVSPCSWTQVPGGLTIARPSGITAVVVPEGAPTGTAPFSWIAVGQPFEVLLTAAQGVFSGGGRVKLVASTAHCAGTDGLAAALEGGEGVSVRASGHASFAAGLSPSALAAGTARACVWVVGTPGYSAVSGAVWPVRAPSVASFGPKIAATSVPVTLSFRGSALATFSYPLHASLALPSESCPGAWGVRQVTSLDQGRGGVAGMHIVVAAANTYWVCWRAGGAAGAWAVATGGPFVVRDAPRVSWVLPTTVWAGQTQVFLIQGEGLGAFLYLKIIPSSESCGGVLGGADENRSAVEGGGAASLREFASDGQGGESVGVTLVVEGEMAVCQASAATRSFTATGLRLLVRAWEAPALVRPSWGEKTDVQRVEAEMTDMMPSCVANTWSRFLLLPYGGAINLETPAIVDRNDLYRCYKTEADIPSVYPQGVGYRPPGVDMRLLELVRGVSVEFVLMGSVQPGDKLFVGRTGCGGAGTTPTTDPTAESVPGGEPVVLSEAMGLDVTSMVCGESEATSPQLTGASARMSGFAVSFTLTEVSRAKEFHRLCLLVPGGGHGVPVGEDMQLKVRAPMLLTMEPPFVFSGMAVNYRLRGLGLSPGDKIRLIDGDEPGGCYGAETALAAAGGREAAFEAGVTTLTTSVVQFRLERPSHHARVCYQFLGSTEWDEMTAELSLRSSGYLYGYTSTSHFFYGLIGRSQSTANAVGSGNQTIAVIAPLPLRLLEVESTAREKLFLTVIGEGFTDATRFIVLPDYIPCGGSAALSINLVKDGSGRIPPHLRPVRGGESRPPASYQSGAQEAFDVLSTCTGSQQRDECTSFREMESTVSFPAGFSELDLGNARVCFMYDFAAEYKEVGQILITPPAVTSVAPHDDVLLNGPVQFHLRGKALRDSDVIKIVDGRSCAGIASSRPYWDHLTVTDYPANTSAMVTVAVTGAGTYTTAERRFCYSYDEGLTFTDLGITLHVRSPVIRSAFPSTLALSNERRVDLIGDTILPGDRVKFIYKGFRCQGTSDTLNTVIGGEGRAIMAEVSLPEDIGRSPWPYPPPKTGYVILKLPRRGVSTVCYLHRGGAGWQEAVGLDGLPVEIRAVSSTEEALGWVLAPAPRSGGAGGWVFPAALASLSLLVSYRITRTLA